MRTFLLKSLIFLLCFAIVKRLCDHQTEGFQLHKISSELPYAQEWDTGLPQEGLENIFKQPFRFLGSGGQCYAFVSADNKYVIKFFKQHHMRKLPWLENMPLPRLLDKLRQKILADRAKRSIDRIFGSYKIAFQNLQEETGLLYLHLNKTDLFHTKVTLIDKIGIAHDIDVDKTEFAVQKYATLTYPHLKRLIKQNRLEDAKECLQSLVRLITVRAQAGIADLDLVLKKNFGFIGNQAVEIDLGSFAWDSCEKKPYVYKRELFYETIKLKKWLAKRSPELLHYLHTQLYETFRNN